MLIHAVKSHDHHEHHHHHHFAWIYNGLSRKNSAAEKRTTYKAIRSSEGGSSTLYILASSTLVMT